VTAALESSAVIITDRLCVSKAGDRAGVSVFAQLLVAGVGAPSRAWQVGAGEVLLPGFGRKAGQRQGESENRRNMDLFIGFSVVLATIVSLWVPRKRAETPSRCCLAALLLLMAHRVCERRIRRRPLPGRVAWQGRSASAEPTPSTQRGGVSTERGSRCVKQLAGAG